MGGSSVCDGFEFIANEARTLVLLGRTGNGKSATGNTILRRKAFGSKASSSAVTSTCELQSTQGDDGFTIDVIDTPGLFDFSSEPQVVVKEIVRCIELAKDGIHANLLVLSVRTRFTREEQAAVECLLEFFGNKISDYMIVVFTRGDQFEGSGETLDNYLGQACPEPLKETLRLCDNRVVLFDNMTKDPEKIAYQLRELLSRVNQVLEKNGGQPYTNEFFKEFKAMDVDSLIGDSMQVINELNEPMPWYYAEKLRRLTGAVESKLKEVTCRLLEQLAMERAARVVAEREAKADQTKSQDEIRQLKEGLERAVREAEEFKCHMNHNWFSDFINQLCVFWKKLTSH